MHCTDVFLRGSRSSGIITHVLFAKEGVYEVPENYPSTIFKTRVWTLIDSGPEEDEDKIPPHLAMHPTKHFIVFTTLPWLVDENH
ncbi:hypothetical protein BJY52DRAFT_1007 [Lactarius psammicola]|nr:hypothetical protein BJY52DRAFT_1007 [Lactarius psammicola]